MVVTWVCGNRSKNDKLKGDEKEKGGRGGRESGGRKTLNSLNEDKKMSFGTLFRIRFAFLRILTPPKQKK
jgi:hypothetical protein